MPDPTYLRFFARIRRNGFDLECPGCGKVYIVRAEGRGSRSAARHNQREAKLFDESTGIFQCTSIKCRRAYQLGINAHPLGLGTILPPRRRVPVDTVPTVDQARTLTSLEVRRRQEVRAGIQSRVVLGRPRRGGKRGTKGSAGPVNTAPACSCPRGLGGAAVRMLRDPGCPRHGDWLPEGETPN